jgi:hypothetical protein
MKHGDGPRTIYGKDLRNGDLAKIWDIEDMAPIFGYVGKVRLDSFHERTNCGSAIEENFFAFLMFAFNFAMELLKIVAVFQEVMPKYYSNLVPPDSKVIKPCAVRKDARFRVLGLVGGAKAAHNTIRGKNSLDVEMLNRCCGMGLINLAYFPPRDVGMCLFERRKLLAGEILVVR